MSLAERHFLDSLESHFKSAHSESPPREEDLSEAEHSLRAIVPRVTGDAEDFLSNRREVNRVGGLHGIMAFEVISFIDGNRSGLDIFRAVRAEANRAGIHYYGRVKAEDVYRYLKNAADTGLVSF